MEKDRFIIWDYLTDLMLNNPNGEEGSIKILLSKDNFFDVLFSVSSIFISFKIEINYSFLGDTEIEFSKIFFNDFKIDKRNNLLKEEEDLIRLIIPLIRENKLKRLGI